MQLVVDGFLKVSGVQKYCSLFFSIILVVCKMVLFYHYIIFFSFLFLQVSHLIIETD